MMLEGKSPVSIGASIDFKKPADTVFRILWAFTANRADPDPDFKGDLACNVKPGAASAQGGRSVSVRSSHQS
jgi:hypothetical protein